MSSMKKMCLKNMMGWVTIVILVVICLTLNAKPVEAASQFKHEAFTILNPVKTEPTM